MKDLLMSIKKWSDNDLKNAISISKNYSDVLRRLNLSISNGNYIIIKNHILRLNLDISHFTRSLQSKNSNKIDLNDIISGKIPYSNSTFLKKRLLLTGLLKNICSICGQLPIWNEKELVLIMDHINGNHTDNRLENLRIICRHCDSQLKTFAGRNVKNKNLTFCVSCNKKIRNKAKKCIVCYKKDIAIKNELNKINQKSKIQVPKKRLRKVDRPSSDDLFILIKTLPFTGIGKRYGVSDNAVRKWAKSYGLPYKLKDIKNIKK